MHKKNTGQGIRTALSTFPSVGTSQSILLVVRCEIKNRQFHPATYTPTTERKMDQMWRGAFARSSGLDESESLLELDEA
jgi:hypothetical protein